VDGACAAASDGVARPYGAGGSSLGKLAWPGHAQVYGSGDAVCVPTRRRLHRAKRGGEDGLRLTGVL